MLLLMIYLPHDFIYQNPRINGSAISMMVVYYLLGQAGFLSSKESVGTRIRSQDTFTESFGVQFNTVHRRADRCISACFS